MKMGEDGKEMICQKLPWYLVIHVFAVDLWLDDVHEWIHQARALPKLSPGLAAFWTHIPSEENEKLNPQLHVLFLNLILSSSVRAPCSSAADNWST